MKKLTRKTLYVGQLVVLRPQLDAQVYTVAEINLNSHYVILQWMEGTRHCSCGHDIDSDFFIPTIQQIEQSIVNGALVSVNDILEWA